MGPGLQLFTLVRTGLLLVLYKEKRGYTVCTGNYVATNTRKSGAVQMLYRLFMVGGGGRQGVYNHVVAVKLCNNKDRRDFVW
jgi:hypothetical protein